MAETITSPYVEMRNGAYYVIGTRIPLVSVIHEFRRGATAETILDNFPHLGSLVKVYGAITFILENPAVVDASLEDEERRWKEIEEQFPLPPDMLERYMKAKEEFERNGLEASISGRRRFQ